MRLVYSMPSRRIPMSNISIIIPAFNEEQAIANVLRDIAKLPVSAEVIVVDDGSTDTTPAIAASCGAHVVRHPATAGYGKSLKDGILVATHDTIVIVDADGSYPIASIPQLLETFARGFDMVVGARQGSAYRGSFLKFPARLVFRFLAEYTTGRHIPDVNSGLRVFRKRDVLPYFPDLCSGFSFTTTITLIYMLTGKIVGYVPIAYAHRQGRSKVRMVHDTLQTLKYLTENIVRYDPLKLFLLLVLATLLFGVVALAFLGPEALFLSILVALLVGCIGLLAESGKRSRTIARGSDSTV